tara:strand:- start:117 stop:413 length:297 start_codon:yes stop_codon:yes gene_type:complete
METLQLIFSTITGNIIYSIIAVILLGIIGFAIFKKLFKLMILIIVCLLAYLGYIYYAEGEDAVFEKGSQIIEDIQKIPSDIKNQFEKKTSSILDSLSL